MERTTRSGDGRHRRSALRLMAQHPSVSLRIAHILAIRSRAYSNNIGVKIMMMTLSHKGISF